MQGILTMGFSQNSSNEFKPNGKPLALIFTNFNTAFSDGESMPAFEITRAYLGYEYNFSNEWYAKVVLDVGNPKAGKHEMAAYLKNAYMQYKKDNLTATFGMISTTQFKVSEKIWGNRYMMKSYQDEYSFNSSADIGFNLDYKLADFISVDFSVINGEGYKKIQGDDILRPGVGATITPIKNVTARVFADQNGKEVKQQSLATFLAYNDGKLVIAGEYNYQKNVAMVDGADMFGTSFYATYKASGNVKLFARYDALNSSTIAGENEAWQISDDGSLILAGVEFSPVKGVKLTPNVRSWNPANEAMENTTFVFLNCELKF